jgi:acetyl-CoA carboxylase carboxyl transferase subunit beta
VVIAAERAWLSPLPPEGASAILYGTTDRAAEMARQQRVGAPQLLEDGIVHHIVAELPEDDAESLCTAIVAEVGAHLRELMS